jgi:energy-coupling factor transporter ATP-binding protein EcfA2
VGWGKPERGPISGPPGSGKSTYIKALENIAQQRGKPMIVIRSKECSDGEIIIQAPQSEIIKKISGVLHFTAGGDGLRPSFDLLAVAGCDDLSCLKEFVSRTFKQDVAMWIRARVDMLERIFIGNGGNFIKIPTCLSQYDEIVKRLTIGIIYIMRSKITRPVVVDDMASLIVNDPYKDAYIAMMRPSIISVNRFMDTKELLMFNPIILAPGGAAGVYRLTRPNRYIVIFDHQRWEINRKEVEKIAYSY